MYYTYNSGHFCDKKQTNQRLLQDKQKFLVQCTVFVFCFFLISFYMGYLEISSFRRQRNTGRIVLTVWLCVFITITLLQTKDSIHSSTAYVSFHPSYFWRNGIFVCVYIFVDTLHIHELRLLVHFRMIKKWYSLRLTTHCNNIKSAIWFLILSDINLLRHP